MFGACGRGGGALTDPNACTSLPTRASDYSSVSKSVNSQVYRSGLYFLGLGHSFIVFPTTLQSVDFAGPTLLKTRTSDGLPLTLGCRCAPAPAASSTTVARRWCTCVTPGRVLVRAAVSNSGTRR